MKHSVKQTVLFLLLSFLTFNSFAWNRSIELGYGLSQDPNGSKYYNSGVMVSGNFYPIRHTPWTFWSLSGALGQWHTTAPQYKDLTTAALSLALRLYPFTTDHNYPVYMLASAGPALLSNKRFGVNSQAGIVTIQTNLGFGVELFPIDVNLRLEHFSNANLGSPNEGFNILYLLSFGYLFA